MNTTTIIIIVCVAVAVVGAITAIIVAKKKGKPISSCCGDCSSCPYGCHKKQQKYTNNDNKKVSATETFFVSFKHIRRTTS